MIGITGTPGTGKTSVAEALRARGYSVLDLKTTVGPFVEYHDESCDSDIVDVDKWADAFTPVDGFVEGAFAHYLPCDKIIILRCRPDVLEARLAPRGYSIAKIHENCEAEALDLILCEAADAFEPQQIYEIDTTCMSIDSIVSQVIGFAEDRLPAAFGSLDFSEYVIQYES
ncbi:MAG TPA: adenylate kinase family protein [Methanocorpusculum sp.]|nr:adenylate kinase family protein [Methanocorpusculum sp.]